MIENQARNLGVTQEAIEQYTEAGGSNHGIKFNQFWGEYTDKNGVNSTLHEKENKYFKPQITLKDFWKINDKFYLTNVAYLSIGRGGGTGIKRGRDW